jgi:hypothetical protein
MSVIDNAKKHFKESLAQGMKAVEVPEWETTLYFKAAVSFAQEQKVIQLHSEGKQVEALVESLVSRACDAEGNKVFKFADKVILMNEVDPAVILRVVNQMNNEDEEQEKDLGN